MSEAQLLGEIRQHRDAILGCFHTSPLATRLARSCEHAPGTDPTAPDVHGRRCTRDGEALRLVTRFVVSPVGKVQQASLLRTNLPEPALEACMLDVVRAFVFPVPEGDGIVRVTYPFVFEAPPEAPEEAPTRRPRSRRRRRR